MSFAKAKRFSYSPSQQNCSVQINSPVSENKPNKENTKTAGTSADRGQYSLPSRSRRSNEGLKTFNRSALPKMAGEQPLEPSDASILQRKDKEDEITNNIPYKDDQCASSLTPQNRIPSNELRELKQDLEYFLSRRNERGSNCLLSCIRQIKQAIEDARSQVKGTLDSLPNVTAGKVGEDKEETDKLIEISANLLGDVKFNIDYSLDTLSANVLKNLCNAFKSLNEIRGFLCCIQTVIWKLEMSYSKLDELEAAQTKIIEQEKTIRNLKSELNAHILDYKMKRLFSK